MNPQQRLLLLQALAQIVTDGDGTQDILRTFLPVPAHTLALAPRVAIIRGGRGVGKTALFRALERLTAERISLKKFFGNESDLDDRAIWVVGFSEAGQEHPSPEVIDAWGAGASDDDLRKFWIGHLVGRLANCAPDLPLPPEFGAAWREYTTKPSVWVPAARAQLTEMIDWLDRFDARAGAPATFVTYDHLDKIGVHDRRLRERFTASLLHLWLSFTNRYRAIRPKVFIRQDLFEQSLRGAADASKLETRSVLLSWTAEDLYRTLLRHMLANPGLREWCEPLLTGEEREDRRYGVMPPPLPEEGKPSQRGFAKRLAGEVMGAGVKKGYVYRWIPTHLQDAHGSVVPRSMLNLIRFAAIHAYKSGPKATRDKLLHHTDLQKGLEEASSYRVRELEEEHSVVQRLEGLRGIQLMAERRDVVSRLAKHLVPDDQFGDDGEQAFDSLEQLGVLAIRRDGRVDIPDIYRYKYNIKRKGGAARVR
jgi:hypothetical protein